MATDSPSVTKQLNSSHGSFELVVSPVILALIGYLIDSALGITPVLTIIAAVLGVAGASVKAYYTYRLNMDEQSRRREQQRVQVVDADRQLRREQRDERDAALRQTVNALNHDEVASS